MKTFTNELCINCNFSLLDKKYDFFQIKSNDKYIQKGSKILDLGIKEIEAIAFDDGASIFTLFKKQSIKSFELQDKVGDELMVKKLNANEIKPYIVARLLLFTLANSQYDDFAFSNLTGKLYLFKSEWISSSRKYFKALNIDIKAINDCSSKIICSACTFTLAKLFKSPKINETYPRYVFSIKGTLKRVFEKDDNSYIRKNINGKKSEIPFLSFFKDQMKLSKSYLMCDIVSKFNDTYKNLAQINLIERQIDKKIEMRKDGPFFDKVVELLIGKTINFVNMDTTPEDENLFNGAVNRIQELLPLTNIVISEEIKTKEMNIVLIHNKEYYEVNNFKDPYTLFDRSTPIQCLTLEDACYKDSDTIYKTIIKELEIKNEIINARRFMIDDWKAYKHSRPFIFGVMVDNVSYFMNVLQSGEFKLIKKTNTFSFYKEEIYNKLEMELLKIKSEEKFVIADDEGNINIISDSGIFPLPDNRLFIAESPRGIESKNNYLTGILDINVYENNNGVFQYSSGPISKTLNVSIPSAPHIYNVTVENGKEIMTSIMETLGVQFVKYNSFTILPYPFKFLKEWVLMSNQNK